MFIEQIYDQIPVIKEETTKYDKKIREKKGDIEKIINKLNRKISESISVLEVKI